MSSRQTTDIKNGDMFYEGVPCKKAGHTIRYREGGGCVRCKQEYYLNLTEDQMKERRAREKVSGRKYKKKLRGTVKGRKQLAENRLKSSYDMTGKDWMRMYEEQNGICANPNCDFTHHPRWWEQGFTGFHVDHDHNTEEVRGLLCPECNTLEGVVFKSPKKTMGIIEYRRVWDENK